MYFVEHYLEMSRVDAQEALRIYRHFCNQTERVTEYLGVAKKLQNLLNIPIPTLKHVCRSLIPQMHCQFLNGDLQAPISLVNSLQAHLNDPNFEQNRLSGPLVKAQTPSDATTTVPEKGK